MVNHLPIFRFARKKRIGFGMRRTPALNTEDDRLVEAVRAVLIISDAMGLSETSIHLNAALTTLDGKGMAPIEERRDHVLH